jgi:hypothetical protein
MTVEDHIATFSQEFSSGRYETLVAGYSLPLPIYVNRMASVARHPREIWSFFQALHGLLLAHGYAGLSGRVASVELPRRGRFRLWVEWSGLREGGADLLFKSLCYNAGSHAEYRTEMFVVEGRGLPNIEQLLQAA